MDFNFYSPVDRGWHNDMILRFHYACLTMAQYFLFFDTIVPKYKAKCWCKKKGPKSFIYFSIYSYMTLEALFAIANGSAKMSLSNLHICHLLLLQLKVQHNCLQVHGPARVPIPLHK